MEIPEEKLGVEMFLEGIGTVVPVDAVLLNLCRPQPLTRIERIRIPNPDVAVAS